MRPDIENRIKEGSIAARFNTQVVEIRPTSVVVRSIGPDRDAADRPSDEHASASLAEYRSTRERSEPARRKPGDEEIPADGVYLLTGYRADTDLMARAGIVIDDRQAPVFNPETFETNVRGLFVAGGAIAGVDTGTVFIENGRFHGQKIVDVIASRQ